MPSREIRRNLKKKRETTVEKKKESHPFLYAFSVGVLLIVVVTFIGLPVASKIGAGGSIVFGRYEGKEIKYVPGNYFSKQREIIAEQVKQSNSSDSFQAQAYKVWRGAFERTVLHTAILLEAERSGIWISEDRIDRAIIKYGPYMENGKFSEKKYNATPNSEKYKTRVLFREDLMEQQYLSDVYGFQRGSSKEENFIVGMDNPERSFMFVSYPFKDYPEEEVISYGKKNLDLFRKIKLSRILIKTSANDAEKIEKKLTEGSGKFEELAKSYSKDIYANNNGDMGWKYRYELKDDFENSSDLDNVFAMKEGDISPVIKGKFGWMIYRCNAPAVKPDLQDPDLLDVIKKYIMKYERGKVEDYFTKEAEKFAKKARETSFLDACGTLNVTPFVTEYFPINYQLIFSFKPVRSKGDRPSLTSANYSKTFFETAFSLKKGKISDPVLLDDQVVVLELVKEKSPDEKEKDILKRYYTYFTGQTIQMDVQNYLTNPDKLEDNFNETFYKYIAPRS